MRTTRSLSGLLSVILLLLTTSDARAIQTSDAEKAGLLVMAHGGSEDWNSAVLNAVAPLREKAPVAVAFGMANPHTLQDAVIELEKQGVSRIEVVRLFISGDSFLETTEYVFGVVDQEPQGHFMHEPFQITVNVPVRLNSKGLMDVTRLGGILADRTRAISSNPVEESVLIIGHGPGSDEENQRWMDRMDAMADSVRLLGSFNAVHVTTLREDWTGKREAAVAEIHSFMDAQKAAGHRVLVIPFRLRGFGPYADVLEGYEYQSDQNGFLPDERITEWIWSEFVALRQLPAATMSTSALQPGSRHSNGHTH